MLSSRGLNTIMSRMPFLSRLSREGKLGFIEPSDETKAAYIKKSESHLASAKLLLQHGRFEESVSMAYYSMYHMLLALLFKTGIKCENHTAAILLLKKVFDIDNSKMQTAKEERIDKQYYIDFQVTKDDVQDLIRTTEEFDAELHQFLALLNNEKVSEYHKRAEKFVLG